MNRERRKRIKLLVSQIETLLECVDDLANEERDSLESTPENFQTSDRYTESESAADTLDDAAYSLNEAIGYLNDII